MKNAKSFDWNSERCLLMYQIFKAFGIPVKSLNENLLSSDEMAFSKQYPNEYACLKLIQSFFTVRYNQTPWLTAISCAMNFALRKQEACFSSSTQSAKWLNRNFSMNKMAAYEAGWITSDYLPDDQLCQYH